MYESFLTFFDLNDGSQPLRNDILRIGSVVFILGFELAAAWLILFDRTGETRDQPDGGDRAGLPQEKAEQRSWWRRILDGFLSLTFAAGLTALILVFPMVFEQGWHGVLLIAAIVLGGLFYRREISNARLHLIPPQSPTTVEVQGLLLATIITALLVLLRWQDIPPAMHRDVASICRSGISMWENHRHPFIFNGAALPGLLDPLYGGGVLLSGDPVLGVRLYPLLCATLCPIILYRWVCLIGSKQLAWFVLYIMLVSPFFQYYSRVPMGVSVWLMQLIFFYGITRSLMVRGAMGPLLGGIALALAQWDYYASRGLILVALAAPFAVLPFFRSLEKGWWYRLLLIASLGILSLIAMPFLMSNIHLKDFTLAMTPKYYEKSIANDASVLIGKILGILRMWFDATGNAMNPLTIPTTPLQLGPFAGLLIVGTGLLLFSVCALPLHLLVLTFACGACCTLFSDRPANGHRVMIAMLPVFVAAGYGVSCLWGDSSRVNGIRQCSRKVLAVALLIWGGTASLMHVHHGMWMDERAVQVQEYDSYIMALRVKERLNDSDIIVTSKGLDQVIFLSGQKEFTFFHYGNWIQPNWNVSRQNAVEATANIQPLMGLFKSLSSWIQFHEFENPAGEHAGWEYLSGMRMVLGDPGAAKQWAEEGRIRGTLMMPESGQLQITCKDYRIRVHTPVSSASGETTGTFQVLRGLNRVVLFPTREGQVEPRYLQLHVTPSVGPVEERVISSGQLYSIPLRGWLEEASNDPFENPGGFPVQMSIIPTIYTHDLGAESVYSRGRSVSAARYHRYRSYPSLPPGDHHFAFFATAPCAISVTVGDKQLKWDGPIDGSSTVFTLNAEAVNGKLMEITKIDGDVPADFSFETILENHNREVPPYSWFTPLPGKPPQ